MINYSKQLSILSNYRSVFSYPRHAVFDKDDGKLLHISFESTVFPPYVNFLLSSYIQMFN